jgi:hypothetical protein
VHQGGYLYEVPVIREGTTFRSKVDAFVPGTQHVNLGIFFFFTLVTGPRRSLSLTLNDTRVYEPQI